MYSDASAPFQAILLKSSKRLNLIHPWVLYSGVYCICFVQDCVIIIYNIETFGLEYHYKFRWMFETFRTYSQHAPRGLFFDRRTRMIMFVFRECFSTTRCARFVSSREYTKSNTAFIYCIIYSHILIRYSDLNPNRPTPSPAVLNCILRTVPTTRGRLDFCAQTFLIR